MAEPEFLCTSDPGLDEKRTGHETGSTKHLEGSIPSQGSPVVEAQPFTQDAIDPPQTMRAVVLDSPGDPSNLQVRTIPIPVPTIGQVLIKVHAFGINRSELHTRIGLAEGVTFPRVLGIECAGVVAECLGGEFGLGEKVFAMMGGMGRTFDGGYAEMTCVPVSQVLPFTSSLPWTILGAVPEMLQTSYGSLTTGLDLQPGQTLLVRGGTSSIGMCCAVLAKRIGATVVSTTRSLGKSQALIKAGVDHVVEDTGSIAAEVRKLFPNGVDAAIELVGTPTLRDTLRCVKVKGVACFTGMLSNEWTVKDFYPIEYIPTGVRLTAYGGDASDLPVEVMRGFLRDVEEGKATVPVWKVYKGLESVRQAHEDMEAGNAAGKLVVVVDA